MKATCSAPQQKLEVSQKKKGECTRSVLKIGRSLEKAHHLEQQDMRMGVRASQEDVELPQGN